MSWPRSELWNLKSNSYEKNMYEFVFPTLLRGYGGTRWSFYGLGSRGSVPFGGESAGGGYAKPCIGEPTVGT